MKQKRVIFFALIVLAAVLLSSCGTQALNNSWPGLATDGEFAYLATGQAVHAVRLSDGVEVWRYPGKASNSLQFLAQPVFAQDGTILIGSTGTDHRLVALDPSNIDVETNAPREKWIFSGAKDRWVAAPLIVNNKVFAPNMDGSLYILDMDDGLATKKAIKSIDLGGALWAQPVSDGKNVYVPSLDHHLYAIDPDTFEFAWPPVSLGGAALGSPLVDIDNGLYIGSFASEVVRIDATSGQTTPFASTQGWVWGGPVEDNETIYFGDLDGYLYAVDASTGKQAWQQKPDDAIVGSPLVTDEFIVIATESGSIYAINREGGIVWQRDVGGQIYTAPVSGSNLILAAPMQADFLLAAYDLNGAQTWTFKLEN